MYISDGEGFNIELEYLIGRLVHPLHLLCNWVVSIGVVHISVSGCAKFAKLPGECVKVFD